jgi:hypothetical protein
MRTGYVRSELFDARREYFAAEAATKEARLLYESDPCRETRNALKEACANQARAARYLESLAVKAA